MNKFFIFFAAAVLALLPSCQKQQTEAERNADVERQVNERLAAEHQTEEQQRLAQRQDELDARVKALSEKESVAATTPEPERSTGYSASETVEASPPASYSMFYTKLEPFGVWRETSTYGYVWQPRAAMDSRNWRPYTNGRWVYTDAGWTWISEEPFGWAAYHYGRWTRLRGIGWVWVPGEEWAPAWVSWRSGNDYVGWAPLPPEARFEHRTGIQHWADNYYDIGPDQYCFVPTREIGTQRIERAVLPAQQNLTIVNQTTNVTNITYNNTTVVNQGPNYEELRTRSQQPIQRLRLERRTTVNIGTENPRAIVRGEVVEMSAPVLARAQAVERPPTIKEKVTQTVVEHGWEGIADNQASQQARAKIKSEATPPPNAPPKTFLKPAPVAAQSRATSRSPSPIGTPIARSTITPKPSVAATSAVQTPSATRFARPTQTAVTKPILSATPLVTASPRFTPFQRAQPSMTPAATAAVTATAATAATPLSTFTAAPRPTVSPRSAPRQFSPLPSASPALTAAAAPPALGRPAETKEARKAQKELRKQERTEGKKEPPGATAPAVAPTATASPSLSVSPPAASMGGRNKQHKKKNHPGEPETSPPTTATPSPSGTPQ
jgi:hypothetical protein